MPEDVPGYLDYLADLDRFAFRNGQWRITERRVIFDWTSPVPLIGESPYAPSFLVGKRDRTDPLWAL